MANAQQQASQGVSNAEEPKQATKQQGRGNQQQPMQSDNEQPKELQQAQPDESQGPQRNGDANSGEQDPQKHETAQETARRLALEAAKAQEDAQQAALFAADKQRQALEAAKIADEETQQERRAAETAKAAALQSIEEVTERARKQQKVSDESSIESVGAILQSTAQECFRQAAEQQGAAVQLSELSKNEEVLQESASREGAARASEQLIGRVVDKAVAELKPAARQPEASTREPDAPSHNIASTEPSNQATADSAEAPTPAGFPVIKRGVHATPFGQATPVSRPPLGDSAGMPVINPTLQVAGVQSNSSHLTYRTTPENQPESQGPAPMQIS